MENVAVHSCASLEEVIQARKAERRKRAEEKRLEDLHKIEENAKTSHDEKGEDIPELPAEVWDKILHNVKSGKDLWNAWNTSSMLQALLRKRRALETFLDKVLQVPAFVKALSRKNHPANDSKCPEFFLDLLNLRRVNVTCHNTLDEFYQSLSHWLSPRLSWTLGFSNTNYAVESEQILQESTWILHLFNHNNLSASVRPNFFTFKSFQLEILMDDSEPLEANSILRRITDVLELIGGQIDHFILSLDGAVLTQIPRFYRTLCTWMSCMSGLKSFELEVFSMSYFARNKVSLVQLRKEIKDIGFVTLPTLQSLDIRGHNGINQFPVFEKIVAALLHFNPQIRNFTVDLPPMESFILPVQQVQNLSLNSLTFSIRDYLATKVVDIVQLMNSCWPLVKIDLFLEKNIFLNPLFCLLGHYPNLECVKLELYRLQGSPIRCPLNLPNVRHFELKFNSCSEILSVPHVTSLDFLIHLGKLETIVWDWRSLTSMTHPKEKDEVILFNQGKANLYGSNIWKVFPALSEVKLGKHVSGFTVFDKVYKRSILGRIHKASRGGFEFDDYCLHNLFMQT